MTEDLSSSGFAGIGELSGRYELRGLIARGGMAEVHEGFDRRLQRAVAVKVLDPAWVRAPERFLQELRALGSISHPSVVRLLDAGTTAGNPCLVLELVAGHSLQSVLRRGPLPPADVAAVGRSVAGGLQCAHGLGIVHRDIKPANILIDRDGQPRLTDFGVAQLTDAAAETLTEAAWGTAAYLAPEQVRGREVGPAADVYSLGLVLLESLTGRKEYPGPAVEAALARLARDPEIPPDLPPPWPDLLRRMLDRRPEVRPSAGEVARWLAAPETAPGDPTRPPRRRRLIRTALAGALAAALAALLLAAGARERPLPRRLPDAPAARSTAVPAAAGGPAAAHASGVGEGGALAGARAGARVLP